jgi:hypothetical protein
LDIEFAALAEVVIIFLSLSIQTDIGTHILLATIKYYCSLAEMTLMANLQLSRLQIA